jgi:hypothetical protein
MRKIITPAFEDPWNSVDLIDGDRINPYYPDEPYCVAPAIRRDEVDYYWSQYIKDVKEGKR